MILPIGMRLRVNIPQKKKDEAAHVYGAAGTERYTCTVCGYVSETRKNEAEAADKNNTENNTENSTGSETVSAKRTEANDVALNAKFNVKTGKTIRVTWEKLRMQTAMMCIWHTAAKTRKSW